MDNRQYSDTETNRSATSGGSASQLPSPAQEIPEYYFETCFKLEGEPSSLPLNYGIITAYATTGEKWTAAENLKADAQLKEALSAQKLKLWRITGYSPKTGHAEAGWAVELPLTEAIEIGKHYLQHAIYYVRAGQLTVHLCDNEAMAEVGPMKARLHPARNEPSTEPK
ncbi:DUF3293 domain-containing protein [bacterium]|nr:DUF3293 domain-containing protein [bacterium]